MANNENEIPPEEGEHPEGASAATETKAASETEAAAGEAGPALSDAAQAGVEGPALSDAAQAGVEGPALSDAAQAGVEGQLRRERDDYFDRLLRKTAEFDNYRKRIERERREQAEWASAEVITDLLSVLDDLDRALAVEAPPEAEPYRAGFELIRRQLAELVRKRGATPIDALGADFDPHLHQAVAYEETPGAREGEVIDEFRKGYKLGDRLLRPALVKVAKAS